MIGSHMDGYLILGLDACCSWFNLARNFLIFDYFRVAIFLGSISNLLTAIDLYRSMSKYVDPLT